MDKSNIEDAVIQKYVLCTVATSVDFVLDKAHL